VSKALSGGRQRNFAMPLPRTAERGTGEALRPCNVVATAAKVLASSSARLWSTGPAGRKIPGLCAQPARAFAQAIWVGSGRGWRLGFCLASV